MGASLTMIYRHYGHLARDGREHAIRLQRPPWTLVDAGWTPGSRTPAAETTEAALSRRNPKPSDGHEPSTPPYDGSSEASGEIERGYASTEREGDTAPSHDSVSRRPPAAASHPCFERLAPDMLTDRVQYRLKDHQNLTGSGQIELTSSGDIPRHGCRARSLLPSQQWDERA
jgi:hypothetical protein